MTTPQLSPLDCDAIVAGIETMTRVLGQDLQAWRHAQAVGDASAQTHLDAALLTAAALHQILQLVRRGTQATA